MGINSKSTPGGTGSGKIIPDLDTATTIGIAGFTGEGLPSNGTDIPTIGGIAGGAASTMNGSPCVLFLAGLVRTAPLGIGNGFEITDSRSGRAATTIGVG